MLCKGCHSLKYSNYDIPYCNVICGTTYNILPKCPCHICLVKVTCISACDEFENTVLDYIHNLNENRKIKLPLQKHIIRKIIY
jgi:hypothetical protein